jgi:hypothetical protein
MKVDMNFQEVRVDRGDDIKLLTPAIDGGCVHVTATPNGKLIISQEGQDIVKSIKGRDMFNKFLPLINHIIYKGNSMSRQERLEYFPPATQVNEIIARLKVIRLLMK